MRGRVAQPARCSSSPSVGGFRAGVTADLFGTIPSVLISGIGTLLVCWSGKAFPALFRMNSFEQRYR